jgi:hypothetical protein
MQFGSMPIPERPRSNSVPVTATVQEVTKEEEHDPRRGSFFRPLNFIPESVYTTSNPSDDLIQARIDLLNSYPNSPRSPLIRHEMDPENGELSGVDIAPRNTSTSPKPKPTREENLRRVGTRPPSNYSEDNIRRNLLKHRASRMVRQLRHEAAIAAREARREAKAQEAIARAASGNLSAEQQAQLDLQTRIQDARRRTQGTTLADNLAGLGLALNPDFLVGNTEDPTKTDDDEAEIADLETIGPPSASTPPTSRT